MKILGDSYFKRSTIFGEKEILSFQTDDFHSIPQKVYKYLDLSSKNNWCSLIEDYLWFSDPTTFNDPFDCKTGFAYHMLAEDEAVCRRYYEFHVPMKEPTISIDEQRFVIEKNVNRIMENKSNTKFFEELEQEALNYRLEGIKEFGVFCTCMVNDNILLWSHYANKHRGICLGLKVDKLLQKHYKDGDMGAGEVMYEEFPHIMPLYSNDRQEIIDLFKPMFLNKAPCWTYELEYRFTDYPCKDRKKEMGDILDSIYIGFDISTEDELRIKKLCRDSKKNIKLYKSKKAFFKYEIEFTKINY